MYVFLPGVVVATAGLAIWALGGAWIWTIVFGVLGAGSIALKLAIRAWRRNASGPFKPRSPKLGT